MIALLAIAGLGAANFAMHKAVLESRHPALGAMPGLVRKFGGRATLGLEFLVLLAALLLAANGFPGWGWAYAGYTALNALAAWLILSRRF